MKKSMLLIIIVTSIMIVLGCSYTGKGSDPSDDYENSAIATVAVSSNNANFNGEQIETIRKELYIPDYKMGIAEVVQGDAYLWEGTGLWMVPVAFYIDDVCIAQADVNIDDCTLMRSVIAYEYDPENEKLETDANPQINDLMERYYAALSDGDIDTLQNISHELSDGDVIIIKAKSSLIDSYDDIHCYTILGPQPDTYIVYVTFYTKYSDISSMIPGLNTYYIGTDDTGNNMYIYISIYNIEELTDSEKNYINALNDRDDVKALIQDVDERYNEIIQSDSNAKEFMNNLPEMMDQLSGVVR